MRKHRDKPFKDWDPEEEEDDKDPLWDEEDEEFEYDELMVKNKTNGNSTTKVSKDRSRRPS